MDGGDDITEYFEVGCFCDGVDDHSKGEHSPRNVDGGFAALDISEATIYNKAYK